MPNISQHDLSHRSDQLRAHQRHGEDPAYSPEEAFSDVARSWVSAVEIVAGCALIAAGVFAVALGFTRKREEPLTESAPASAGLIVCDPEGRQYRVNDADIPAEDWRAVDPAVEDLFARSRVLSAEREC